METIVIQLAHRRGEREALLESARVLAGGGVVLFPTETVYGLGGDGSNPAVVERIYLIKKRSGDKPLVRLITDQGEVRPWLIGEGPARLLDRYWPGPLTVILRAPGGKTRGYRIPGHDFIRRMIKESGVEMVATSANLSGKPAITDGTTARREFAGQVDLIIDGGDVPGQASTVLDLSVSPPRLLREGPVTREQIEFCLGRRMVIRNLEGRFYNGESMET